MAYIGDVYLMASMLCVALSLMTFCSIRVRIQGAMLFMVDYLVCDNIRLSVIVLSVIHVIRTHPKRKK